MNRIVCAFLFVVSLASVSFAGDVGFWEEFALADSRDKALEKLVPGTRDYYFYHCLHYQNTGQYSEVERLLPLWIKRYGHSSRVEEIRNRQALLKYDTNPKESLDFIKWRLGTHFNHQRKITDRAPNLATSLDQNQISLQAFINRAMRHHRNMRGFEDSALYFMAARPMDGVRRRDLLSRLSRPDLPNLAKLVVDDLRYKHSRGFGSLPIHKKMLKEQLDACLAMMPQLITNSNFVNTYIKKLAPDNDSDWKRDAAVREAYLGRLWTFASSLPPVHNTIRAHVLYRRMEHDRAIGKYDRGLFMQYIRVPRNANYLSRQFRLSSRRMGNIANISRAYASASILASVPNDEPLVRDYLQHFLVNEDSYQAYSSYIDNEYLKRVMAEAKLLAGVGDMERWYSMMPPQMVKELRERVELEFAPINRDWFDAGDRIELSLDVKNVSKLIVKVYEVNAFNFYRENGREIGLDINLDGLTANHEKIYEYKDNPLRRVRHKFVFNEIEEPGTYVVDFIGNGKSSRALVRKGSLKYIDKVTPAGHVFSVFDDSGKAVNDASLWLDGHEYATDKDGGIVVPFTRKPGKQKIILRRGQLCVLGWFDHKAEEYELRANMHIERESLIRGKKAKVIMRPRLYVSGVEADLSLLENVELVISGSDIKGVDFSKKVSDFKISGDGEAEYEFTVPRGLSDISVILSAKVENLGLGRKENVADGYNCSVNGIDRSEFIADVYLSREGGTYFIFVLDKSGGRLADRAVNISVKRKGFSREYQTTLKSDADGCISLGELDGVELLKAGLQGADQRYWGLSEELASYPRNLNIGEGELFVLPFAGNARVQRGEVSLLEKRGGEYARDMFASLSSHDGMLEIKGLTRGDYKLFLSGGKITVNISVTRGKKNDGYLVGENRLLELREKAALAIASLNLAGEKLNVKLANAGVTTRVHVFATEFVPEFSAFVNLGGLARASCDGMGVDFLSSVYASGRTIGDEYRYILDRKYSQKYAGNLLRRPELLLNPWSLRKTGSGHEYARKGDSFSGATGEGRRKAILRGGGAAGMGSVSGASFSTLDFLARPAVTVLSLRPGKDGVVSVDLKNFGDKQQLHVVAIDGDDIIYRQVSRADKKMLVRDLRMDENLPEEKHFTEQKRITSLQAGGKLALAGAGLSEHNVYRTVSDVYGLFKTMSGNSNLAEFEFVSRWPSLDEKAKLEKFSKYSCHELNFFLYQKDRAFFDKVVLPFIRNKKDKTFLDHWLCGDDMSVYRQAWRFGRLNAFEKILLAAKIPAERENVARHIRELFELVPQDVDAFNSIFDTALNRGALDEEEEELAEGESWDELSAVDAKKEAAKPSSLGRSFGDKDEEVAADGVTITTNLEVVSEAPAPALAPQKVMEQTESKRALSKMKSMRARRQKVRQYYRKPDKTEEWAENNYYHIAPAADTSALVRVNAFWNDYAARSEGVFLSTNFGWCTNSFTEMMLALAVLDLPFSADEARVEEKADAVSLEAVSNCIVFHKEILSSQKPEVAAPVLVSQNFFKLGDRFVYNGAEKVDKFVTREFVVNTVYGCQVAVTNPTSSRQKLSVLLQIPQGAYPAKTGFYTNSVYVDLAPYQTRVREYHFYFPRAGAFPHYPVHAAKGGKLVAFASPFGKMNVVEKPSIIDTTSWDYVSQNASGEEVIKWLGENNIRRVDLSLIAWRMRERGYFRKIIGLLDSVHIYSEVLWSYGLYHNDPAAIRQYLSYNDGFISQCGKYLKSPLLDIEPVERRSYAHIEYHPLVNARAHQLGGVRKILNARLFTQYQNLMTILAYRPALDAETNLAVVYYLLLQDRVGEAVKRFSAIKRESLHSAMQYDYMVAYIALYTGNLVKARKIAAGYASYSVDKWRTRFEEVVNQLDEAEGKGARLIDKRNADMAQEDLARSAPALDFKIEGKRVSVSYQNLASVQVNYYRMDIELLFSQNPFMQNSSGKFSYIRPNETAQVKLPAGKQQFAFEIPKKYHNSNVIIELSAKGLKASNTYTSNSLSVKMVSNFGRLIVTKEGTGKPISAVYVKVYAKMNNGEVRFYKDGYTDMRGWFDYTSLNTDELDNVSAFSILVLSEENGGVLREVKPPKR